MQTIAEHEAHMENREYELKTARVLLARSETEYEVLVQRLHKMDENALIFAHKSSDDLRRSVERFNVAVAELD
eukprot:9372957-Heterocapsa_arctica.AAC.1